MGGLEGRALRKQDVLQVFPASPVAIRDASVGPTAPAGDLVLNVVMGPQADRFTDEGVRTFLGSAYEILPQSDRMGARLRGPRIAHAHGHDIISDGIAFGSVQVPGDGQPIILLVDRQSTGGYTKIATVCSFDIDRVGQLRPGARVRFEAVTLAEAHRRRREHEAALAAVLT
jgi:allophanate hydrolase subunit 2